MSNTNRGAIRETNDRYITPDYTVESLAGVLDTGRMKRLSFCEPCRGTGAIYNRFSTFTKYYAELSEGIDYLTTPFTGVGVVITNPPFSLALPFLQKSLSEARTVIYLLRLNFLGSETRRPFWQTDANRPSHILVLSKRPKFTNNGSDSCEYAWFCWDRLGIVNLAPGVHVL
jgi:hypothetical protein